MYVFEFSNFARVFVMYVLEPIFHKTIWGGGRFVGVYGEQAAGLGHLYSLRCNNSDSNVILNGKYAGRKLFDAIGAYPLSIALVDALRDLSIQVHPGGKSAKYESYYFIDAPKSGCIYCGLAGYISATDIRTAVESGSILPHISRVSVEQGDYICIEPHTVHALTSGSFVYEIEQGEDNTYRLFDYDRTDADGSRRELHIEQATSALDVSRKATTRKYQANAVIREKTYETRLLKDISSYVNHSAIYECLTLLSGVAVVADTSLKIGMSVLVEPGETLERLGIERCIAARPLG
jgi:mannose-6-phosphate isomerase